MAARRWLSTLLAAVLPVAVAAGALPLRARVPSADVAAVLVGVVTLGGTLGGRWSSVLAAVSGAVAFDLFWAQPYGSLDVRNPGDGLTGAVVLVVGFAVAEACRRRGRGVPARWRPLGWVRVLGRRGGAEHLGTVSRVAEDIADGDDAGLVVLDVARALTDVLGLEDCRFERPPFAAGPETVLGHGGELQQWGIRWDPAVLGLPQEGFCVRVVARGRVEGRFVCVPRTRRPVARGDVLLALTLADQAASALLLAAV